MNPREDFLQDGGRIGDWSEALEIATANNYPINTDLCAVVVIGDDGVPALLPNPRPGSVCRNPDHIYTEALRVVADFRASGPQAPWERLRGGSHISGFAPV